MSSPSEVDVLIFGAGPAGLMAATWMSRFGITTRIVDKRGTKIFCGQADGVNPRTQEIFASFGYADRLVKEANPMLESRIWNPGPDGGIVLVDKASLLVPGISRFHEMVLHQGRIERFMIDDIREHSKIEVERGVLPASMKFDRSKAEDLKAHPFTVELRHLTEDEAKPPQMLAGGVADGVYRTNLGVDDTQDLIRKTSGREGSTETVKAKYVIGCDGAHSWTRQQLGFELEGDASDFIWGVLDIIPITDFPDIRYHCLMKGPGDSGTIMIIPREKKLVRLYIQLTEVSPDQGGRADRSQITPETILKAANRIFHPYKLEYKYCDWWTAYQVGQRICNRFSADNRIFIAGDAVHTHSPKAGLGMNVSMQDTYNLCWKLGLVIKGLAKPSLLSTYEDERRAIAKDLIAFDHILSGMFSGVPPKEAADQSGVSIQDLMGAMFKAIEFILGMATDYAGSTIIAKAASSETSNGVKQLVSKQELATGLPVGRRFKSYFVTAQSDARSWHFAEHLRADGRFRIVLFAGDISQAEQKARVEAFCAALDKRGSFLRKFTPPGQKIDSVIQILTIHTATRSDYNIFSFPDILHPFDEIEGWEYNTIFTDEDGPFPEHGEALKGWGVDPKGCVVIVRPDQHVAYVGALEDVNDLEQYFGGVLLPQAQINGN